MEKIPLFKNKKFLTSLFGIFIISIMVFSVLNVYETRDKNNIVKYKNYEFVKKDNYWSLNYNGKNLDLRYNPSELEDIKLVNYNIPEKLYIAYDPKDYENELFVIREGFGLFSYASIKPVLSCSEEKDCPDIPLIDCKVNNAIILKYIEDKTNVYIDNNCLVIEGNTDYQLKYLYKMIYNILGI